MDGHNRAALGFNFAPAGWLPSGQCGNDLLSGLGDPGRTACRNLDDQQNGKSRLGKPVDAGNLLATKKALVNMENERGRERLNTAGQVDHPQQHDVLKQFEINVITVRLIEDVYRPCLAGRRVILKCGAQAFCSRCTCAVG